MSSLSWLLIAWSLYLCGLYAASLGAFGLMTLFGLGTLAALLPVFGGGQ